MNFSLMLSFSLIFIKLTAFELYEEYSINRISNIFEVEADQKKHGTIEKINLNEYQIKDFSTNSLVIAKVWGDEHFFKFDIIEPENRIIGVAEQTSHVLGDRKFQVFSHTRELLALVEIHPSGYLIMKDRIDDHVIAVASRSTSKDHCWFLRIQNLTSVQQSPLLFYVMTTLIPLQEEFERQQSIDAVDGIFKLFHYLFNAIPYTF